MRTNLNLEGTPIHATPNCSPVCNHQEECTRCRDPKCIKYMKHSRLYGYACRCGSQEWRNIFEIKSFKGDIRKFGDGN